MSRQRVGEMGPLMRRLPNFSLLGVEPFLQIAPYAEGALLHTMASYPVGAGGGGGGWALRA